MYWNWKSSKRSWRIADWWRHSAKHLRFYDYWDQKNQIIIIALFFELFEFIVNIWPTTFHSYSFIHSLNWTFEPYFIFKKLRRQEKQNIWTQFLTFELTYIYLSHLKVYKFNNSAVQIITYSQDIPITNTHRVSLVFVHAWFVFVSLKCMKPSNKY